ncbi:MAG: MTH1187 family thiamine-binding protein [Candidatus Zixiibacteriota bacterium]
MLAFFSISPLGEGESVSKPVAEIVQLIADSGLEYQLTAMGTIFEGTPDQVFDLLKACHMKMRSSHRRVTSKILIDDRGDDLGRIRAKIASIEMAIGRPVQT